MKIQCMYDGCGSRRVHHEKQDEPRGPQFIEAPDDIQYEAAYCSFECSLMDGYSVLRFETPEEERARISNWKKKH